MNDSAAPLLLDTSAWVHYLRPRGAVDLKSAVQEALGSGRVATCWVVKAELLVGARDPQAFDALSESLRGAFDIPITDGVWEEAARLGYDLRKHGTLVPLPDLLIAQCAITSHRLLWHADEDFERIRQLSTLRTRHWQVDLPG